MSDKESLNISDISYMSVDVSGDDTSEYSLSVDSPSEESDTGDAAVCDARVWCRVDPQNHPLSPSRFSFIGEC